LSNHCLRHLFTDVFAQRMRNFVAQHVGKFRIGQVQLSNQPRVHHDLSPGHAECIEFVARDDINFPFPAGRIGAKNPGLRFEATGNVAHAIEHGTIFIQYSLPGRIGPQLGVAFGGQLIELF
jgi:hypothetical protein